MAVYNVEVRYGSGQWQHLAGPFRSVSDAQSFIAEHRRDAQSAGSQYIPDEARHILETMRDSGSGPAGHYLAGGRTSDYRIV